MHVGPHRQCRHVHGERHVRHPAACTALAVRA
jgi:hypothetical protein